MVATKLAVSMWMERGRRGDMKRKVCDAKKEGKKRHIAEQHLISYSASDP